MFCIEDVFPKTETCKGLWSYMLLRALLHL